MCVSTAFGRIGQALGKVEGLVVRLDRGSSNLPGRIGKPRKCGVFRCLGIRHGRHGKTDGSFRATSFGVNARPTDVEVSHVEQCVGVEALLRPITDRQLIAPDRANRQARRPLRGFVRSHCFCVLSS